MRAHTARSSPFRVEKSVGATQDGIKMSATVQNLLWQAPRERRRSPRLVLVRRRLRIAAGDMGSFPIRSKGSNDAEACGC